MQHEERHRKMHARRLPIQKRSIQFVPAASFAAFVCLLKGEVAPGPSPLATSPSASSSVSGDSALSTSCHGPGSASQQLIADRS